MERLGPDLARAAERYAAARLWSIRLRTLLAAGAVAVALAAVVFAVSYGAGFQQWTRHGAAGGQDDCGGDGGWAGRGAGVVAADGGE